MTGYQSQPDNPTDHEITNLAQDVRRLRAELHRAQEEIARLTELLGGRDQEIRALRAKLGAKGLQVNVGDAEAGGAQTSSPAADSKRTPRAMTLPGYLMWTKEGEALFDPWSKDPNAWVTRAEMLRIAAAGLTTLWQRDSERITAGEKLADCPYVLASTSALMLAGMALETLTKGVIVRQRGMLPDAMRSHALARLLETTGTALNWEEAELVERLEILIRWFGRYPVPKKPEEMRFGAPARQEDLEVFSRIYSCVSALLQ